MEKLYDGVLTKFRRDTLKAVRKEFGLNHLNVTQIIDDLEKWVIGQNHFVKKDFSHEYLERTLITCKGSIEKTKMRLDRGCTSKNLLPHYFENLDGKIDIEPYDNLIHLAMLPQLTESHERVFILRNNNYSSNTGFFYLYRYFVKILEYIKAKDYNSGVIVILDYSNLQLKNLISKMNLVEMREIVSLIVDAYGLRVRKICILSASDMIDAVVKILRQVLPTKLGKRLKVYKKYKGLFKVLPQEILPEEYDGPEKCIDDLHEDLLKEITTENFVEYLKEMGNARTNEEFRDSKTFNDSYLGTPGFLQKIVLD